MFAHSGAAAVRRRLFTGTGGKGADHERRRVQRSIRKFLKTLGVSAQREIEKAVRQAVADGKLKGNREISRQATVTLGGLSFSHEINGEIELG